MKQHVFVVYRDSNSGKNEVAPDALEVSVNDLIFFLNTTGADLKLEFTIAGNPGGKDPIDFDTPPAKSLNLKAGRKQPKLANARGTLTLKSVTRLDASVAEGDGDFHSTAGDPRIIISD